MKANFLTPVVTAFDKNGNLDYQANKNIYDHLIAGGVDGIVVMGSTGEFFAMPMQQKKELIKLAVQYINKRTRTFIGVSCMSEYETIELANYADEMGADAVLVVSPYYFSLSDESIELFYDKVAEGTKADVYIYNFPDRTGYDLKPEIILRLARKHKNIVGYKDTVSEMSHTRKLIDIMHEEFSSFKIFNGFDENFAHTVLCGGSGCIGALSNLVPEVCSAWVKAADAKDFEKVAEIQKTIDTLMELYEIGTPFIPIIKKAMMIRGIEMQDYCTFPFIQANEEQTIRITKVLQKVHLI